jgi:thiamine phosphate synthase YjbQ (UPF0047 family)
LIAFKIGKIEICLIHSPQAIIIIERVQKVMTDILRSFESEKKNENLREGNPFDHFIHSPG